MTNLFKTLYCFNYRNNYISSRTFKLTKIILILFVCLITTFLVKTAIAAEVDDTTEDTGRETSATTQVTYMDNKITQALQDVENASDAEKNANQQVWISSSADMNAYLGDKIFIGDGIAQTVATLANPNNLANVSWSPKGLIGATNNAIASLYTPPASGIEYIANSFKSIMGKPIYANDGFNQLKGIQSLWKICRNMVYTFISIIFVIMGLLIMLRIKISPQATITIQNSIPKIIVTLILVTFSYAICGLIIDATYLLQALLLQLITKSGTTYDLFSGAISLPNLIKGSWDTHWSLVMSSLSAKSFDTTALTAGILGGIVGAIIGAFTGLGTAIIGTLLGFLAGLLILLIFAFTQLIKFFFGCAKAYIILILKIISAPLEIALGAFPNSKIGFSSWLIQTIAYASIFPISILFLVVLNIILRAVSVQQIWTPGVLQGGIISGYIGGIIGLSGLTILAKLPDLIPEAIFQIKPSPFGKAVSDGLTHNALVNRVRGGFIFETDRRLGSAMYGVRSNLAFAQQTHEAKVAAKRSKKLQEHKDENPPQQLTPNEDKQVSNIT